MAVYPVCRVHFGFLHSGLGFTMLLLRRDFLEVVKGDCAERRPHEDSPFSLTPPTRGGERCLGDLSVPSAGTWVQISAGLFLNQAHFLRQISQGDWETHQH
jgi:hypothetical protein